MNWLFFPTYAVTKHKLNWNNWPKGVLKQRLTLTVQFLPKKSRSFHWILYRSNQQPVKLASENVLARWWCPCVTDSFCDSYQFQTPTATLAKRDRFARKWPPLHHKSPWPCNYTSHWMFNFDVTCISGWRWNVISVQITCSIVYNHSHDCPTCFCSNDKNR